MRFDITCDGLDDVLRQDTCFVYQRLVKFEMGHTRFIPPRCQPAYGLLAMLFYIALQASIPWELTVRLRYMTVWLLHLFSTVSPSSRENLLDHCGLSISIVLRVFPVQSRKLPLGALVEPTIGCIAAQPVAEEQHAVNLRAAR